MTRRQREFRRLDIPGPLAAALVADALSNKQIAERLVLSGRAVEAHVSSILAKLGFTARTEIATWQLRAGAG